MLISIEFPDLIIPEIVLMTFIDGLVSTVISVGSSAVLKSVSSPSSDTSVTSSVLPGESAIAVAELCKVLLSIASWLIIKLTL